ncbi:AAEL017264-PA, partial [Aedes aegypti]
IFLPPHHPFLRIHVFNIAITEPHTLCKSIPFAPTVTSELGLSLARSEPSTRGVGPRVRVHTITGQLNAVRRVERARGLSFMHLSSRSDRRRTDQHISTQRST